jgi:hypothetical protein
MPGERAVCETTQHGRPHTLAARRKSSATQENKHSLRELGRGVRGHDQASSSREKCDISVIWRCDMLAHCEFRCEAKRTNTEDLQ